MSLMSNIKNYLINFSGIHWDEVNKRYNLELDPNEGKKEWTIPKKTKPQESNPSPTASSSQSPKSNKEEFDYTYGGQAKFNTRDILKENEAYRDTVYTNYLGKDKNTGKDKFDLPTVGYGQTLKHALANDEIEMVDKYGNKKKQTGAEWHEELDKDRQRLVQGSGKRQGKAYYDNDDTLEWKISDEEGERLTQLTNKRYLDQAKKVADDYAKKYGSQYAWENLSPMEQMQVYQSSYGGAFTKNQTYSGNSINKGNIYLDMKRAGINPETATDEQINSYLDKWYKDNVKSPGSKSREIAGTRYRKTKNFYQKRNCKE